jgi:hypothetical protein
MADKIEDLLRRRANVADQIVAVITKLGTLVRQQTELEASLRRISEADGSRTNPFATQPTFADAVNAELTAAGLDLRRADPSVRLTTLVGGQHDRYRSQREVRKQVAGRPAAA